MAGAIHAFDQQMATAYTMLKCFQQRSESKALESIIETGQSISYVQQCEYDNVSVSKEYVK